MSQVIVVMVTILIEVDRLSSTFWKFCVATGDYVVVNSRTKNSPFPTQAGGSQYFGHRKIGWGRMTVWLRQEVQYNGLATKPQSKQILRWSDRVSFWPSLIPWHCGTERTLDDDAAKIPTVSNTIIWLLGQHNIPSKTFGYGFETYYALPISLYWKKHGSPSGLAWVYDQLNQHLINEWIKVSSGPGRYRSGWIAAVVLEADQTHRRVCTRNERERMRLSFLSLI